MPSPRPLVLLVDDDPVGRDVVEAMLADEGLDLVAAANGAEALSKATELRPDLVLLDVMMPGIDGFEVLRRLRADPALAEMPVMLVTALNDRESRLRGLEAGADDFLTKPIDRLELQARVRTVTRLDRYRRLQSERAKFEWAVETADDGFLLLGAEDRIVYANPRARLLLGVAGEGNGEAPGFRALAGKQYRCEPEQAWRDWPQATEPILYLVRPESPRAPAFWLHVDSFPLPTRLDAGWLVRLRDVSERLQAQREVWAFHSAMHHKLRTPLAGMLPSLELLATDAGSLTPEAIATFAAAAFKSAERLQGEIEDVLAYLDVSHRSWTGDGCDLGVVPPLATGVAEALGIRTLTVSGAEGVRGVRVPLSAKALELLLGELMENAKKFHPRTDPAVEVTLGRSGERATLSVCDDGVALPPEQLGRALSPYYQAEKRQTGQVAGMGLGLPMVASVLWSVGGSCRVGNRSDVPGVVVEMALPVTRA